MLNIMHPHPETEVALHWLQHGVLRIEIPTRNKEERETAELPSYIQQDKTHILSLRISSDRDHTPPLTSPDSPTLTSDSVQTLRRLASAHQTIAFSNVLYRKTKNYMIMKPLYLRF